MAKNGAAKKAGRREAIVAEVEWSPANCFIFNEGITWQQVQGLPMRFGSAPQLANIRCYVATLWRRCLRGKAIPHTPAGLLMTSLGLGTRCADYGIEYGKTPQDPFDVTYLGVWVCEWPCTTVMLHAHFTSSGTHNFRPPAPGSNCKVR